MIQRTTKGTSRALPQTHHVHRCRRHRDCGRGRRLRHRQRNRQQQLSRCQHGTAAEGGIQRSVWTSRRGNYRHGRERVQVDLHRVDIGGSEGDHQQDVLHEIHEGDALGLGQCRYNGQTCPRTWDDQRNDHHGDAGHRATDWRRICDFLGGGPLPARCTLHVKAGRSDPVELQSGSGTIVSGTTANKATKAALAAYPGGIVDRVVKLSNGEYEVHNIGVNWPHHIFVGKNFKVIGAN